MFINALLNLKDCDNIFLSDRFLPFEKEEPPTELNFENLALEGDPSHKPKRVVLKQINVIWGLNDDVLPKLVKCEVLDILDIEIMHLWGVIIHYIVIQYFLAVRAQKPEPQRFHCEQIGPAKQRWLQTYLFVENPTPEFVSFWVICSPLTESSYFD